MFQLSRVFRARGRPKHVAPEVDPGADRPRSAPPPQQHLTPLPPAAHPHRQGCWRPVEQAPASKTPPPQQSTVPQVEQAHQWPYPAAHKEATRHPQPQKEESSAPSRHHRPSSGQHPTAPRPQVGRPAHPEPPPPAPADYPSPTTVPPPDAAAHPRTSLRAATPHPKTPSQRPTPTESYSQHWTTDPRPRRYYWRTHPIPKPPVPSPHHSTTCPPTTNSTTPPTASERETSTHPNWHPQPPQRNHHRYRLGLLLGYRRTWASRLPVSHRSPVAGRHDAHSPLPVPPGHLRGVRPNCSSR